ncbi:solute carrier family 22 member 23 [Engraulis encrasicolus]|uniref:solute carrier family 22 member 23 n=1 Tax=Engraulis encrasicolus TaxID=184585 RepID=UPI002FD31E0B
MCETAMAVVQLDTDDHQPENGFVSPETTSPALLSRIDGCVLPFLGGFGKYQKQLIVLTWIPALFIGFSQFSDSFLLAQPNSTCVLPMRNGSNLTLSPSSLFNGQNNSRVSAPHLSPNGTRHNNYSADAHCRCTEWKYDTQMGLKENVVTKWNLVCDNRQKVHIAKFSLLVGSIFGYLVMGILADWFGRHPVLIISVFFMLVFGFTVAFSVNVPMFSTLRFFEGFCLAGISLSLYVLRIELCLPGWRFSMTMVANFVVVGGQLLMPGVAALCRDWQVLQAFIICPLVLMLSYIWLLPESLRWLLATQQFCRSKWLIARIAKKNKANLEREADDLLTELQQALQKKPKRTCIVKMVGTRNLWKNIVVLCVNSLTGYGIHHCFARSMMYQEGQEATMFHNFYADYYVMAGIAVASCIALCPAVGLMGRRGGLLMFMIVTALASLLQLGLLNLLGKYSEHLHIEQSDTLKSNFSVAFSIIGMFSSHAVSNLSIFFCAEITPTVIRGGGLGLVLASAGFGMLTAPIMELHDQKGYFLHHVIFACCTLICIICILLLPETRYQPLPETLEDGENYTRQPLLPPRKPGEQHLLLTKPEGREYARVAETPPLEAEAAAAVSTMDSTASSAVDLTLPSIVVVEEEDVPVRAAQDKRPPPAAAAASTVVVGAEEDDGLCKATPTVVVSTPERSPDGGGGGDEAVVQHGVPDEDKDVKEPPSPTPDEAPEPIQLTCIEPELPLDSSTPLLISSIRDPQESPPSHHPPAPAPDLISTLSTGSPGRDPPMSPAKNTSSPTLTPATDSTVPTAKCDSPGPDLIESSSPHLVVVNDTLVNDSDTPLVIVNSPAHVANDDSLTPEVEKDVPLVNDNVAFSAAAAAAASSQSLTDPALSAAQPVNHSSGSSPAALVTDCFDSPVVDSVPLNLVDSPVPPLTDSLPVAIPPVPSPSPSPPLSRDSIPPSITPPPPVMTAGHSAAVTPPSTSPCHASAAAAAPSLLPVVDSSPLSLVTDTVQAPSADSEDSPSPPAGSPTPFSMDCTVSSPIDSGLTAADAAATANGVASS